MNFPEDITHTYSNQVTFREIVRTEKVPSVVNVYTVPWDSFEMMTDMSPNYDKGIITVINRPRNVYRMHEEVKWSYYYDEHICLNDKLYDNWEKFKWKKYKSRYLNYLGKFYNHNWVIDRELTLFTSMVAMLKHKGAKTINFYRVRFS
mgnify:FL=1